MRHAGASLAIAPLPIRMVETPFIASLVPQACCAKGASPARQATCRGAIAVSTIAAGAQCKEATTRLPGAQNEP